MLRYSSIEKQVGAHHDALDSGVWAGVRRLLDDYVRLSATDDVVVVYTPDSRNPAAWVSLALHERRLSHELIPMAPLHDPGFADRLMSVLPDPRKTRGRFVLLGFEQDTMSHGAVVRKALRRFPIDKHLVVWAINAGADLFRHGLSVTPAELSALNATLLSRFGTGRTMQIRSNAGTSLEVGLDNQKFRWISNRGMASEGRFLVLPPGEVATYPASLSGTFVADFAINVNYIYDGDVRLNRSPVRMEIEESTLVDYRCEDPSIMRFLEACFSRPHSRRVGELGFGTNRGVTKPCFSNSHLNERYPGVHIGFGQHNQKDELTGYQCDIHVDMISDGGRVIVDGDVASEIDLSDVLPGVVEHPTTCQDIDLFTPPEYEGDCCGITSPLAPFDPEAIRSLLENRSV